MASKELLNELDELNEGWMETVGKFMFLDEEEIMQYWEKVEATLTTHVVSKNPTMQRGQTIVANIIPKLH